jgi:hypothetical protein
MIKPPLCSCKTHLKETSISSQKIRTTDPLLNWELSAPATAVNFSHHPLPRALYKVYIKSSLPQSQLLHHSHGQPGSFTLSLNFACWTWDSLLWAIFFERRFPYSLVPWVGSGCTLTPTSLSLLQGFEMLCQGPRIRGAASQLQEISCLLVCSHLHPTPASSSRWCSLGESFPQSPALPVSKS